MPIESIVLAAEKANIEILTDDSITDESERIDIFTKSLDPLRYTLRNLDADRFLSLKNYYSEDDGVGVVGGNANGDGGYDGR